MTGNETGMLNNFGFGDSQHLFLKTLISKGSLQKTFQKWVFNSKAQNMGIKISFIFDADIQQTTLKPCNSINLKNTIAASRFARNEAIVAVGSATDDPALTMKDLGCQTFCVLQRVSHAQVMFSQKGKVIASSFINLYHPQYGAKKKTSIDVGFK